MDVPARRRSAREVTRVVSVLPEESTARRRSPERGVGAFAFADGDPRGDGELEIGSEEDVSHTQ